MALRSLIPVEDVRVAHVNSEDNSTTYESGVAYKAGVKPGDIIIMFNNVEIKYSYQVRGELGKFLLGSGEIAEMVVIRNNQKITLYIEF